MIAYHEPWWRRWWRIKLAARWQWWRIFDCPNCGGSGAVMYRVETSEISGGWFDGQRERSLDELPADKYRLFAETLEPWDEVVSCPLCDGTGRRFRRSSVSS